MKSAKDDLRQRMREEARGHSIDELASASRAICEKIRAQAVWQNAHSVLLFAPTPNEPDITPLLKEAKRVSLPSFSEKLGQYEAREISGEQDLVPGQFGIWEPKPACSLTNLSKLDLILAPGVAFALDGSRLGRGKGYYDRLLERVKATKIGVCFDWQVLPQIPRDGHDVIMDHIVTPTLFS